jgi:hypothetical protein
VVVLLATCHRAPEAPGAVTITFVGYTNAPNKNARFALFAVTNGTGYDLRYWGDLMEIEGEPHRTADVFDAAPPPFNPDRVIRAGASGTLPVSVPLDAPVTARWRYRMVYRPYSLGLRWLDFLWGHKLPDKIGPIKLVDYDRLLAETNDVTVVSDWLTR